MARKLSPDKRAQYLSSALRLFVANGVRNTSTNAIAKEAGTAAGTFFLYFPTKQDLIHELVLKIAREQSDYIKSLLKSSLSVQDTFFMIWDGSIRWFIENMEAYQYFRQVRDSGMIVDEIVRESEKFFDYYYDAIHRGHTEDVIKPYPSELIGSMLYQDIVAVINLIGAESDREKQEEYIQHGFDIFWDGIENIPGR